MFQNASSGSVVCVFGIIVDVIRIVACHKLGATSREIESHLGKLYEK